MISFPRIWKVVALGALASLPALHGSEDIAFHVAPAPLGDDAHAGTSAAPFATLDRARLAVRSLRSERKLAGDVVVLVHGGTYELTAPLRFEPEDSGQEDAGIIYRAAPGESPVLSGGRRITGWSSESVGVIRADVGTQIDFRQLWVEDRRAVRARTPNVGATLQLSAEKTENGFDLPREPLASIQFTPNRVELAVIVAWMHKRLRIVQLENRGNGLRAVINPLEWDAVNQQPQGDRVYLGRSYWLENAREFLDDAGEFFLDRATGILRYRTRRGEQLDRLKIVRPELESIIVLEGRLDQPVHHLRFEGLTFAFTGWTRPNRSGFVDVQANSLVPADLSRAIDPQYRHNQRKDRIPAAFQANTADHIQLVGNRFARLGGTGVAFNHGGNDNQIEENSFYDLSANGIEVGEDAFQPASNRLFPRRNRIANNFIAHIGEEYFGSVGILAYYTDALTIEHNELAALPYTGISQGWGWGLPLGPADARGNRILSNHVKNFMRRLDDGGGIYTTNPQAESEVGYNFVERMTPPNSLTPAGGALYPDQCTEGFHWHDNVVAESSRWLYLWNPNIRGNRIDHNYADTPAHRDDGPNNHVEAVTVIPDRRWTGRSQTIVASAGLEPKAVAARHFAPASEIIVESSSVDFQILDGKWLSTGEVKGSYRQICVQSSSPEASARWMPILPASGAYEISAWRSENSPAAEYTIQSEDVRKPVVLNQANLESGWVTLGTFSCAAGAQTDITIRSLGKTTGVIADSIRLRKVRD